MAKSSLFPLLLIFSLLLLTPPLPTSAIFLPSFTQLRTTLSLSHSLLSRVANLRTSRGNLAGARRAHLLASTLRRTLSLPSSLPTAFSFAWDYLKNYAWRDTLSLRDAVGIASDVNELLSQITELTRLNSDSERAAWVSRNYKNVLRVSKSVFNRLLSVFNKSGPLREMVEILKEETVEGDLLKDCLEVGSNDLKGLAQILKDLASRYSNVDDHQEL